MAKQKSDSTFESLGASIAAKQFVPLYCFCGDEPYFVDELTELIELHVLNEMEKAFNMTVVYGKDSTARQIVEAAMRPPMMAERQLVLVKEAQGLELRKDEDQTLLLNYFKKPNPQTVMVFAFKNASPDKRKALWKELTKGLGYYESEKLRDYQIAPFIKRKVAEKKFKIQDEAAELMSDFVGTELSKVINEVGKIVIGKPAGHLITVEDIEREVGISREYNAFELNNAISKNDVAKAYRIAQVMANSKSNPLAQTLAAMHGHFSKLLIAVFNAQSDDKTFAALLKVNPFFVKDYREALRHFNFEHIKHILHLIAEYDLRSKGVGSTGNTTEGELLKELVYRILHENPQDVLVEFQQ